MKETRIYKITCIVLFVCSILLTLAIIFKEPEIRNVYRCEKIPACSTKGIETYCGESCSDICNLDCPEPSSYCNEIDDICPETILQICNLMKGEICVTQESYFCNEPSKYECDSAHKVGNASMVSINVKCSDGRIKIWDCKINNWS